MINAQIFVNPGTRAVGVRFDAGALPVHSVCTGLITPKGELISHWGDPALNAKIDRAIEYARRVLGGDEDCDEEYRDLV